MDGYDYLAAFLIFFLFFIYNIACHFYVTLNEIKITTNINPTIKI